MKGGPFDFMGGGRGDEHNSGGCGWFKLLLLETVHYVLPGKGVGEQSMWGGIDFCSKCKGRGTSIYITNQVVATQFLSNQI